MSENAAKAKEARLAAERNEQLAEQMAAKRAWCAVGAAALIVLAAGAAFIGLGMIALSLFGLGLILLLQSMDAHGNLHEVRRRSTKTLVPDFSVLRRPDEKSSTQSRPAS